MLDVRCTIEKFVRVAQEKLRCYAVPGLRLCPIINGLSFLLAYLFYPWETHEEWVE